MKLQAGVPHEIPPSQDRGCDMSGKYVPFI
jgi:hypothetical protein